MINGSLAIEVPYKDFRSALSHLSTENVSFMIGAGLLVGGEAKRLSFKKQPTSPTYAYVHCFKIRLEMRDSIETVFGSILENIGGWIALRDELDRPALHGDEGIYNPKFIIYDANDETWSIGYLLEVEAKINLKGYSHRISWKRKIGNREFAGLTGIYPINSLVSNLRNDLIILEDSVIDEEVVYGVKRSQREASEAINDIIREYEKALKITDSKALSEAFTKALRELGGGRLNNLYTFQEFSCISVLRALTAGDRRCIVLTARTAGGKTLAFLLPISIYSAASKLSDPKPGVKSLLFYPTKALCHDQADVIVKMLWHLNKYLNEHKPLLTIGILHGDTYDREWEIRNLAIGETVN